jgi:peptide/nickel transport system substrate-binding protein
MDFLTNVYIFITSLLLSILPAREIREGVILQPTSFYPMKAENQVEKTVSKLLFRGLFKYNIYGELENDLAENYSISPDGLEYEFKLKDNQYWTSGQEITADDLLYTAFNSPSLQGISIDRVDDLTVKFKLQNKYAPFLGLMTQGIIPNNSLERNNDLNPISSGDFKVINVRRSGPIVKEIVLYTASYKIEKLIYRFYNSDEELFIAANLGEIDLFLSNSVEELDNFNIYKVPVFSNSYGIFFNLSKSRVPDLDFRQKISKVIDYKEVSDKFGASIEGPISRDPVFTSKKINFNKFDKTIKEDLKDRSLEIKTIKSERNKELMDLLSTYLDKKLNVDLNATYYEPEEFLEKILKEKDFDAIFFGIETIRDPDRYVNWHSSGIAPGFNFTSFQNPTSDKSLEDGRQELDTAKRINHYSKFQEMFDQNTPAIFLFHPTVNYYVSNRISGIGEKVTFDLSDRYQDFFNWVVN